MKAAVFHGAYNITVEDVPIPEPAPYEVLIRVHACGICGSDLAAYKTGTYAEGLIIGHEFGGEIVRLGSDVRGWRVGDRVTCNGVIPCGTCWFCRHNRPSLCQEMIMPGVSHNGAFAEYVALPARGLLRLPDNVSYRQAALVDPLSNALHAVRLSGLKAGDRALILGAGPIGLCVLLCARLAGARAIYVSEISRARREMAARLGADAVFDPRTVNLYSRLDELTEGRGPDIIFECAGVPQTLQDAITLVRPGGEIMVIALCEVPVPADFMTVTMNELTIRGSYCGQEEYPMALDFIAQGRVNAEEMISHVIGIEDIVTKGFEVLARPETEAVKVLVAF